MTPGWNSLTVVELANRFDDAVNAFERAAAAHERHVIALERIADLLDILVEAIVERETPAT